MTQHNARRSSIVLGSCSPRRREILTTLEIAHVVVAPDIDEAQRPGETADHYVKRISREKAMATNASEAVVVHRAYATGILTADTVVVFQGEVCGKPANKESHRHMLRALSANIHEVVTVVTALAWESGAMASRIVTSRVEVAPLSDHVINAYVLHGEGSDKAGGYALQGFASGFIRRIEGSPSNVVGLPALETIELLTSLQMIESWPKSNELH